MGGGTRDGYGTMPQLGHMCLRDVPARYVAKLDHGGQLQNSVTDPQLILLGHDLARPETGRSWLSLQARNQPGQNLSAICGRFPIAAREWGSPSPASRGVRPQILPGRGPWDPTWVQPQRLSHSPHVPSQ